MGLPRSPVVVALGFEMGLYSRADVSAWVDRVVAQVEAVDGPLLELVTLRGKHDTEIVRLLSVLAGTKTSAELARTRLGILYELFTSDRIDLGRTTAQVFRVGLDGFTNEGEHEEYNACIGLDDAYELADAGTYGTLQTVREEVLAFLKPYADALDAAHG
jgi:hypothetical protein